MFENSTFWTTLSWLWNDHEQLSDAAFLLFIGFIVFVLVPVRLSRMKGHTVIVAAAVFLGYMFLTFVIAWPSGRLLPAIDYGRYDVVQMKNTGSSLFLVAGDKDDWEVKAWWLREWPGEIGWDLPMEGTTPQYVDGEYQDVTLCVGSVPEYRTYITVCGEE